MDTIKMGLAIVIPGVVYAIGVTWQVVAHRRLGKPLPRSVRLGFIFGAIAILIIVAHAVAASLD